MVSSESNRWQTQASPASGPAENSIAVGLLESGTDALDRAGEILADRPDVTVEPIDASGGVDAFAGFDCIVRAPPAADRDDPTESDDEPALPVIAVASDATDAALESVGERWPGLVEFWTPGEPADRLVTRIRLLVAHERVRTLARRATDALESTTDGMAIVAPDGTITHANRLFAQTFGAVADDVVGRGWQELYAEGEAERLESEALTAVDDGWRWIGTCEIRRLDGETATVQTSITGTADGSLVFSVYRRTDRE